MAHTLRITVQGGPRVDASRLLAYERNRLGGPAEQRQHDEMDASYGLYGFCIPVFIWVDTKGKDRRYVLDGAGRCDWLDLRLADGWRLPPLPVVKIKAPNKATAKEICAVVASDYARRTQAHFDAFFPDWRNQDHPPPFLEAINLPGLDMSLPGIGDGGGSGRTGASLAERWGAPPFSVLDARQGYWMARKAQWRALGVDADPGREHLGATCNQSAGQYDYMTGRGSSSGGSSFDPVLAELAVRWWCPPGGAVLDPWAGEAVKGVVCGLLGYEYTGVELRAEQVAANQDQWGQVSKGHAGAVPPTWLQGDSADLDALLPARPAYDMVWSSPPYYDLEVYSDQGEDGSAMGSYASFLQWYRQVIAAACKRLRTNRLAAIKVGDLRDKRGMYRNFVSDTIQAFLDAGLHLYNEAILVTPAGTLPIRAAAQFKPMRKLPKGHQNILVFYKGNDPTKLKALWPEDEDFGLPDHA